MPATCCHFGPGRACAFGLQNYATALPKHVGENVEMYKFDDEGFWGLGFTRTLPG